MNDNTLRLGLVAVGAYMAVHGLEFWGILLAIVALWEVL